MVRLERIELIEKQIEELHAQLDSLRTHYNGTTAGTSDRIDRLEKKIDKHYNSLDEVPATDGDLKQAVNQIHQQIEDLAQSVSISQNNELVTNRALRDFIFDLSKRMQKLEESNPLQHYSKHLDKVEGELS